MLKITFAGEINRQQFAKNIAVGLIPCAIFLIIMAYLSNLFLLAPLYSSILIIPFSVYLLWLCLFALGLASRRLRHIGLPAVLSLMLFVPYANLIVIAALLLVPGKTLAIRF